MTKLKLDDVIEDKPVKMTIEFPAEIYSDLLDYATVISADKKEAKRKPEKLVVPMISRFMATDRALAKARRAVQKASGAG
ncbi:DUF2274 domain-containing protein [Sphingorhabdus sp. YGSMI21]|uniref:DUF2274 domain-containing protein n=1 Tax=Sphingorhabdus sp. YGSMI21 TaxID=2077182 RepID=UPI000C1F7E0B|nr:DUF2274 domain-containing protein [Sphingorhabdus sp. YGSMI21]ATW05279.1 hypothetical protein CHN51_18410 [Sphingorhabdus sp. YGSMI21]